MTDWVCARCGAQVAPGAPRCPECPSTEFVKPDAEADGMLKISRDGTVSDSADVAAVPAAQEHPGTGEPMTGIEHPADGTMSPEISNAPVPDEPEPVQVTEAAAADPAVAGEPEPEAPVLPPRPPRRTPPAGA